MADASTIRRRIATAPVCLTTKKTLYLANPYGFSPATARRTATRACEGAGVDGADVWEPLTRNSQNDQARAGLEHRIEQADLRGMSEADGLFTVVNGCPQDEGFMVELGMAVACEKPVCPFRDERTRVRAQSRTRPGPRRATDTVAVPRSSRRDHPDTTCRPFGRVSAEAQLLSPLAG